MVITNYSVVFFLTFWIFDNRVTIKATKLNFYGNYIAEKIIIIIVYCF